MFGTLSQTKWFVETDRHSDHIPLGTQHIHPINQQHQTHQTTPHRWRTISLYIHRPISMQTRNRQARYHPLLLGNPSPATTLCPHHQQQIRTGSLIAIQDQRSRRDISPLRTDPQEFPTQTSHHALRNNRTTATVNHRRYHLERQSIFHKHCHFSNRLGRLRQRVLLSTGLPVVCRLLKLMSILQRSMQK